MRPSSCRDASQASARRGGPLAVFLCLAATCAAAATYRVNADGSGNFATIQAALSAAASGDVIIAGDGVHTGNALDFQGKAIVLRSENGAAACAISSFMAVDSVFKVVSGEGPATVIDGFTIIGGNATNGGGIRIVNSSPTIVNNIIKENDATRGGGIHIDGASSSPFIVNNLIVSNRASAEGGGVYNAYGTVFLRNNTVAYNQSPTASGMRFQGGTVDIAECIFWGNWTGTQLSGAINGSFNYNLVYGWSGPGNNFDGNPAFTSGPGGSYYLGASSAAIDAGGVAATAASYTAGGVTVSLAQRTTNPDELPDIGTVDVGFHYQRAPGVHTVPGVYPYIQAAIDGAIDGDTIVLVAGVHSGPGNRDIVIDSKKITVRGPLPGRGTAIIDCQGSASEPHRAFLVRNVHENIEIADLTIVNGYGGYGGAILASNASPNIRRCTFTANRASQSSGAIHVPFDSRAVIEDCTFTANQAADSGGACAIGTDYLVIRRCVFSGNWAYYAAGALYFNNAGGIIEDCLFWNNTSNAWGGAIHVNNAYSEPTFRRCTFHANGAPQGAHFYARNNATATISRSILSGSAQGAATYCTSGGTLSLSCSDVFGNAGGDYTSCLAGQNGTNGNISLDPLFCTAAAGDFTLDQASPCLAANNGCGQDMGAFGVGCGGQVAVGDAPPPAASALRPNVPNPFNPRTTLTLAIPRPEIVDLAIYDPAGRLVRRLLDGAALPAGVHHTVWDGRDAMGRDVAAGTYLARLTAGSLTEVRKMALLR